MGADLPLGRRCLRSTDVRGAPHVGRPERGRTRTTHGLSLIEEPTSGWADCRGVDEIRTRTVTHLKRRPPASWATTPCADPESCFRTRTGSHRLARRALDGLRLTTRPRDHATTTPTTPRDHETASAKGLELPNPPAHPSAQDGAFRRWAACPRCLVAQRAGRCWTPARCDRQHVADPRPEGARFGSAVTGTQPREAGGARHGPAVMGTQPRETARASCSAYRSARGRPAAAAIVTTTLLGENEQ